MPACHVLAPCACKGPQAMTVGSGREVATTLIFVGRVGAGMADDDTADRTQGVEFGDLDEALASHDYPATTADIVDSYGDHELGLPEGETTVESALRPLLDADDGDGADGSDEGDTYESADEVRQSILSMVGDDAVGSEGYSDRGGQASDTESDSF
jgi:hypothetical protein